MIQTRARGMMMNQFLGLRCRTQIWFQTRAQTRARRMMLLPMMMVVVNFLKLALLSVHASLACACAYWYILKKNK